MTNKNWQNVNQVPDMQQRTLMHIAARQGDLKLMKTYIEQGAELETKDDTGVSLSCILRVK